MTLPASFPISASQINVELGRAAGAAFDMQGATERALAAVPSGAISMSDFLGKSRVSITQTDSRTTAATSHASVSFGSVEAGAWVGVLAYHSDTGSNPGITPTATIGGVAATRIVADSTGDGTSTATGVVLFTAQPGVSSGTVNVSWNGLAVTIVVFKTIGYNLGAAYATNKNSGTLTLNIPATGFAVGGNQNDNGTGNITWTNLTERGDEAANNKVRGWAWDISMALQASRGITVAPFNVAIGKSAAIAASFSLT